MSEYSDGNVTVVVGSQTVTGTGTRFDLYVANGNIFRLIGHNAWYEVADVVSSQQLTLSARYANSTYETTQASEQLATISMATRLYSGTLDHTPVVRSSLTIIASNVTWEDDGAGVLATSSGAGVGIAGTVDYDAGSWAVSISATANMATANFLATYNSGDTLNAMSYQIITDYTPNYDLPEIYEEDSSTAYTVTKAFRLIDAKIYNASINTATASRLQIRTGGHLKMGSHQYIFFGSSNTAATIQAAATLVDASVMGSMYMSSAGSFWKFTSDTEATRF